MSHARIHFWGAAGGVTGSKFLLEADKSRVLIDCGMFQGLKARRLLNRAPWPEDPSTLQAVVLTHGHLDHVGLLPRLVRDGFRGAVYGTAPTLEIARIVLEDSAKIQEEQAEKAAAEAYSRHAKPEPLYTTDHVALCLPLLRAVPLDHWSQAAPGVRFRFRYNGHILGAAFVEVEHAGRRYVFSGDVGRPQDALLFPPERPVKADVLLLESTYGNVCHREADPGELLAAEIRQAVRDRATCIIPSFAVERLQTVMYLLWQLRTSNRIPPLPIYIDSPMGIDVWSLFSRFPDWHRLPQAQLGAMGQVMDYVRHYRETWEALDDPRPKVVVAGSGMLTGGRVLTYLSQLLDRPQTRVVLVGFQAEGTRGRNLLDGASELKIFGKYIPVAAQVRHLEVLSAHADQRELLWWVSALERPPGQVFLVHGEATARDTLRVKLRDQLGWEAALPEHGQVWPVTP
ncbi:MBL fold metallo-hydrolase [Robiginitalea sp. M366]|uniref:MBL fold metallo-hydrolase RNA specificity domain-containing protein n=1 Tax=Robiginitalea aestuariiviva TaxID=3036903 RepID=UPI00240D560B|nr:MBL fold metallo-hydrolase [Robiginitalea aestuariiviva]MDG1572450.1 MBL fold metallo-hydrolase [Robiginitalea aestuariiviva]